MERGSLCYLLLRPVKAVGRVGSPAHELAQGFEEGGVEDRERRRGTRLRAVERSNAILRPHVKIFKKRGGLKSPGRGGSQEEAERGIGGHPIPTTRRLKGPCSDPTQGEKNLRDENLIGENESWEIYNLPSIIGGGTQCKGRADCRSD